MTKIRQELKDMMNQRKPESMRKWSEDSFQDQEVKRVRRRDAAQRMETNGIPAQEVDNKYLQDRGVKIQVVDSDVAALTPPWRLWRLPGLCTTL